MLPELKWSEWVALIALGAVTLSLFRAHRDKRLKNFDLYDLLMENNRVSKLACVFMGSWGVLTWMMMRLTLDGKMTEGYFTSYATACFAGTVAKLFVKKEPQA